MRMKKLVLRSFMLVFFSLVITEKVQSEKAINIPTSSNEQTVGTPAATQQTITIKGVVKDESNEPMPGVNVVVEGTTIGTMTDGNGHFSLNLPSSSVKIKFSYIGYKEQIVPVKDKKDISIIMNEDSDRSKVTYTLCASGNIQIMLGLERSRLHD